MNGRVKELDFLKCVFIILMIIFHLAYIGDKYPICKNIVYMFHMPAFLIISGYLVNINKSFKAFSHTMLWIFIPYAILESGYVLMSLILPTRDKITELTLSIFLRKIFISPMGPYWYLHTLMLCSISYYAIYKLGHKCKNISRLIMLFSCFLVMSHVFHLLSLSNAIYFMIGIALWQSKIVFTDFFQPSKLAIIPFFILCFYYESFIPTVPFGTLLTYLAISISLFLHNILPHNVKALCYFIGRNTLVILLFSPIFTILSKLYLPVFAFDNSGMFFMCSSIIFVISGCLILTAIIDKLHLSLLFWGKQIFFMLIPMAVFFAENSSK